MLYDELSLRVRYAETDQMKVVYYSEYFKYFEEGRASLLRNYGIPYSVIENSMGCLLPVVETHAKFIKPARFEDIIIVKTYIREKPSKKIRFDSEIFVNNELITKGYSIHVFIRIKNYRISSPPNDLIEIFYNNITK
jgi:acyl-CoA thioester hydrolase